MNQTSKMSSFSSIISKKIRSWDLTESRYAEIDDLPLMSSPGPTLMILAAYLLFVLKVGPNYMMKKEAFKLTGALIIYNAIQVIYSALMVKLFFGMLLEYGLFPRKCYLNDDQERKGIIIGIWIYYAAKVSELLDTVFFVLRKKNSQVTFLHLYHHSCMMVGTWVTLKFSPSHTLIFIGFINSLVHVVMYLYYGLAAMGPGVAKYLTWKKYMTSFQLIQFVCIICQYLITVHVSECPPGTGMAVFIGGNTAFFLLLFLNFYRESYLKKKKTHVNGKEMPNEGKIFMNGNEKLGNGVEKKIVTENGRNGINKEKVK